jgi:hypothetical protein
MSVPEQEQDQDQEQIIEPWADPVSYYNGQLELTLEVPADWQGGSTPDCPLQLVAPPRGDPPYQVGIRIFVRPAPPGPEMLPFVAEEIFNAARTPAMLDYKAADMARLSLGSSPAFLHRSSWGLKLPDGTVFDLRQQMLVVAALERLYIFSLVVPPYLTDAAGEVFITMIQMARYGSIEPDEEEASPAGNSGGSGGERSGREASPDEPSDPSARVAPNGRWRSRFSGAHP